MKVKTQIKAGGITISGADWYSPSRDPLQHPRSHGGRRRPAPLLQCFSNYHAAGDRPSL